MPVSRSLLETIVSEVKKVTALQTSDEKLPLKGLHFERKISLEGYMAATPYGPVLEMLDLPQEGADPYELLTINPFALLVESAAKEPMFFAFMQAHVGSSGELVFYTDGLTSHNGMDHAVIVRGTPPLWDCMHCGSRS